MASQDPAVDSGLKAVSLLKRHSMACNITPAASLEGSILPCNDYRHASPPARTESRGVVDVQVDFTGLAFIRPHRSSQDRVRRRTPQVSRALTSLDPRWGRSVRAIVMSSLNNSSKSMTSCDRVGLSLTGHSCLAPYCDLVHVSPCRRQLGAATDQRCGSCVFQVQIALRCLHRVLSMEWNSYF